MVRALYERMNYYATISLSLSLAPYLSIRTNGKTSEQEMRSYAKKHSDSIGPELIPAAREQG